MSRLIWNDISTRRYHAGLDRGVFYDNAGVGRAWSGLVSAYQDLLQIGNRALYLDGVRRGTRKPYENHIGRIETFMPPEELSTRGYIFGLSYRTMTDSGYQIHILTNVMAVQASRLYSADPSTTTPSAWDLTTTKSSVGQGRLSSHLIVDSATTPATSLAQLEDILYGDSANNARLPNYDEIVDILESGTTLRVTYLPDKTYNIEGSPVVELPDGTYDIDWPSVIEKADGTFDISSL